MHTQSDQPDAPTSPRTPAVDIRQILCPTDGSDVSQRARDYAIALARWYHGEITALTVHSGVMPSFPDVAPAILTSLWDEQTEHTRELLRTFREPLDAAGVPYRARIEEGNPADQILAVAEEIAADLIVLGTHGTRGFERWLLGSVTERVLHRTTCPVLTVPPHAPGAPAEAGVLIERLLCPIDFSDASMRALEYALSLAEEAGAHLTVLHAVEITMGPVAAGDITFDAAAYAEVLTADSLTQLRAAIPAEARGLCQIREVVVSGTPYREILRVAEEDDAHMIVMGVHGRNALGRMFFGSTTNHVVRDAACPVLTLRG